MPPAIPTETTHYALVIDAGSSGSRLQVYSWRDPDLERAEIVQEVRDALSPNTASPSASGSSKKWWWPTGSRKGKGKAREEEVERKALRRLVRVGKGVEGDDWVKRVEPGTSLLFNRDTRS
jgi:Golgi apyrase